MATLFDFENEATTSVDYFLWFQRVVGWDAALPLFVSIGSIAIANVFKHQPPADIIALAGLPVVGFLVRLAVGRHQIEHNACGNILRCFQLFALIIGLFGLVVVDFFTALSAFVPNGKRPDEITVVCFIAYAAYLTLAVFAMYPGRLTSHSS
jgi:hypothetical protein